MKEHPRPEGDLETDPRFPSGPWVGFFTYKGHADKTRMELRLAFSHGTLTGEGRDRVGEFIVRGQYDVASGETYFTKGYIGRHDVFYKGFNEGKGIWGTWEFPAKLASSLTGGFHIWPKGMPDPTQPVLATEAEPPIELDDPVREFRDIAEPVGV